MNTDLAATRPVSTIPRRNSVYVQVPISSYSIGKKPSSTSGDSLKENAPLRAPQMQSDSSLSSLSSSSFHGRKRKLSDAPESAPKQLESEEPKVKKAKRPRTLSDASGDADAIGGDEKDGKAAKKRTNPHIPTEEFPNGAFYCHQCNKKRDLSAGLQCTFKNISSNVQNSRCRAKYCKACLKNRYGKDLDEIKNHGASEFSKREKEKHVSGEGFYFQCPKCKDECNCRVCRKAKGLEATGNLTLIAKKAGKSAAGLLADDPSSVGILPGKGQQVEKKPRPRTKKEKATEEQPVASTSGDAAANEPQSRSKVKKNEDSTTKPRASRKPKTAIVPKVLPKPVWSRIYTDLDLPSAETRMNIREFALRFAANIDLSKGHQEELEELQTPAIRSFRADPDEEEELVSWISEPCTKAVILGLLSLVADDTDATNARPVKEAIKDVRTSGGNLTKIWTALAVLRDELSSGGYTLSIDIPDPLPPPASATFHNTRSGFQTNDIEAGIFIATSAQLVPVIASLMVSALQTRTVRDELERSAADEKDIAKEVKEAINKENAKYRDSRASGKTAKGHVKMEREQHKQVLLDLEFAQRVATATCLPRFSPLGQDHEGRLYYALTPGAAEREAALQLVAGKDGKVKSRRRAGLTEEGRLDMRRWSWFVAVYGKVPEGADILEDDDDDEDEEHALRETPRWWGFWQPEEVKKIAEWLAVKCNLDQDAAPRVSEELESRAAAPRKENGKGKGVVRLPSVESALDSLDESRPPSPLSDISSDGDSDGTEADDDGDLFDGMCVGTDGRPVPTKRNLHDLVIGLRDYSDLLRWRIQRVDGSVSNGKDSGSTGPISAKSFYG